MQNRRHPTIISPPSASPTNADEASAGDRFKQSPPDRQGGPQSPPASSQRIIFGRRLDGQQITKTVIAKMVAIGVMTFFFLRSLIHYAVVVSARTNAPVYSIASSAGSGYESTWQGGYVSTHGGPIGDDEDAAAQRHANAIDAGSDSPFSAPNRALKEGDRDVWFMPDYNWTSKFDDRGLTTCVIVRTYANQRNALVALIATLLSSRHPGIYAILVDTGKKAPFKDIGKLAQLWNSLVGRDAVFVSRWTYHNSRAIFPQLAVEDYGYVATDLAMEDALYGSWPLKPDGEPVMHCDTFLVTNGDNLYSDEFFIKGLKAIAVGGFDMVGQHWISHYPWEAPVWESRTVEQLRQNSPKECGSLRTGRDMEMWAAADFHISCIDLGAVLFRRWLLDIAGRRFVLDALAVNATGKHVDMFTLDGRFFNEIHNLPAVKTTLIREVYMVHQ